MIQIKLGNRSRSYRALRGVQVISPINEPNGLLCHDRASGGNCGNCIARHISICTHMDKDGLSQLRAIASQHSYAEGQVIFDEEQSLDRIYIVIEGMIKLYRHLPDGRRQVTGFLGKGDILGGIRRNGTAHCGAEAINNVKLCGFNRKGFLRLLQDQPNLCLNLLIAATDEIEAQHDHVTLLGRKNTAERLAAFLLMLAHRWPGDSSSEEIVVLPMSRADIADHLGQTIESVSRGLRKFKKRGYVEMPKPSLIVLKNLPALHQLAGFEARPLRGPTIGI